MKLNFRYCGSLFNIGSIENQFVVVCTNILMKLSELRVSDGVTCSRRGLMRIRTGSKITLSRPGQAQHDLEEVECNLFCQQGVTWLTLRVVTTNESE